MWGYLFEPASGGWFTSSIRPEEGKALWMWQLNPMGSEQSWAEPALPEGRAFGVGALRLFLCRNGGGI